MGSGKSGLYHNTFGNSPTHNNTPLDDQIADMDQADFISGLDANGALSANLTSDIKNEYEYQDRYLCIPGKKK